jgi:CRISPR-associated endonuclease Csy4
MKYYIEITLLDNPDYGIYELWGKLYAQLHLALVEIQHSPGKVNIGVSFPEYIQHKNYSIIGSKLRLFAPDEATLNQLDLTKWLEHLKNYIHYTSLRQVPEQVHSYAIFQRYQLKTNRERLARRYVKRHGLTAETALAHYKNFKEERCELPYIRLKSLTNANPFNLFIEKKLANGLINQGFGTYGLSSVSSTPEF